MLYRLEIENFYSIRNLQVIDTTIAPNVPDLENRYAPIFEGSELRTPKVVAIYGANASGKTTVLRALYFLTSFVRDSINRKEGFNCDRFNDQESTSRPIKLAIEWGGPINLSPETTAKLHEGGKVPQGVYRYELEINVVDGVAKNVKAEALRQKPLGKGKWQRVFERDDKGQVKGSSAFPMVGYQHLQNTLPSHVSVLSSFSFFKHPTAQTFVDLTHTIFVHIESLHPGPQEKVIIDYLKNYPDTLSQLNKELNRIDIGVEELRIVDKPTGPEPMFRHSGLDVEMPWALESHGTRCFIKMFPLISLALSYGGMGIVDEFDSAIHPMILPEIIGWFYDKQKNPNGAQFWFTCHSASLLDHLNKEEIILCDKDGKGITTAYSLMDVKSRRDDNLYSKYLSGVYGGVPQIG